MGLYDRNNQGGSLRIVGFRGRNFTKTWLFLSLLTYILRETFILWGQALSPYRLKSSG
jgi:hypothetical protein